MPDFTFDDENGNDPVPLLHVDVDVNVNEVDEFLPDTMLQLFKSNLIQDDIHKRKNTVCRVDGVIELRREIMGVYKNSKTKLTVPPRIRFEEEEGVGSGPLRELFAETMKVIDEGIPSSAGKPPLFLKGEADHRVPTHDFPEADWGIQGHGKDDRALYSPWRLRIAWAFPSSQTLPLD